MAPQNPATNAMEIDRLATQLAKDPHSKAFLPLAEEYCKAGMWEEAVSVLEDGLKHYPGFITAMVVLGRAYDQLSQPVKARAVLEGAIKLSPENLRAHRILIKIYAAYGLTQDALKSCRVILTMNPKDEEALSVQASLAGKERELAGETAVTATHSTAPEAATPIPSSANESDINQVTARSGPITTQLHSDTTDTRSSRRPDAVAQLEAWLRTLEQRRRDRPAPATNP